MRNLLQARLIAALFGCALTSNVADASESSVFDLSLEELMDLRINTAGKRPERIRDIPASITIISREDIESFGFTSLTDILENIPGFFNIYNYEGISGNFGSRGQWNERSQNSSFAILINGRDQRRADDRSNPFSKIAVPVESIDRLEVIRGPMSTIYGNGASLGVINIVTNEQREDKVLLSVSKGSNNYSKYFVHANKGTHEKGYVANISYAEKDGLDHLIRDMTSDTNFGALPGFGVTDPNAYSFKDFLDQRQVYAEVSSWWKSLIFDITWQETDTERFILLPSVQDGTNLDVDNLDLRIGYKHDFADNLKAEAYLSYNDYDHSQDFDALFPNLVGENTLEYQSYEIEAIFNWSPSSDLGLVSGIGYRQMRDFREFTNIPAVGFINESVDIDQRITSAIYSQATYELTDNLIAIAGYRYEKVREHDRLGIEDGGTPSESTFGGEQGGQISRAPRLAMVYHLDQNNSFKAMYGQANLISNDRFDPEKTKTTELQYLFSEANRFFSTSLFYTESTDLVVDTLVRNNDNTVTNRTSQSGEQTTYGVETEASFTFENNLEVDLGVAWSHAEDDKQSGVAVDYSPEWVVHARTTYKHNSTTYSALARFVDNMEAYFDPSTPLGGGEFGARIGEAVPSYIVYDLLMRFEDLYGLSFLSFKIKNVLNTDIRYPNNRFNNELLDLGTLGSEREFFVNVGFEL